MRYRAFISFSHEDNKYSRGDTPGFRNNIRWAQWLLEALESYVVPKGLSSIPGTPTSLKPVFQAETELSPNNDLPKALQNALDKSDFLIVICSPRSASSPHVNEEIRYFKSLGRSDAIIPVTIDGTPPGSSHSTSVHCFPGAILHPVNENGEIDHTRTEPIPLSADLRHPDTKREILLHEKRSNHSTLETAKLKLVAALLGVPFDLVVDRDRRRRARQLRKRLALSAIVGATLIALATTAHIQRRRAERTTAAAEALVARILTEIHNHADRMGDLRTLDDLVAQLTAYCENTPPPAPPSPPPTAPASGSSAARSYRTSGASPQPSTATADPSARSPTSPPPWKAHSSEPPPKASSAMPATPSASTRKPSTPSAAAHPPHILTPSDSPPPAPTSGAPLSS